MSTPYLPGVTLDADGLPVPDPDFKAKQKDAFMDYLNSPAGSEAEPPHMYGVDPGQWRDLSARIPGLIVTSAGGGLPFQSEGTLHGMPYYFKFRSGWASIRVGGEDCIWEPVYTAGTAYGDEWDGILSRDEFVTLMCQLVPQLARAKFRYRFMGFKVDVQGRTGGDLTIVATDIPEEYVGWGHTPQEAFEDATQFTVSEYLIERGWSEADQRTCHDLRRPDPTPVNVDERVFPDKDPEFVVAPS